MTTNDSKQEDRWQGKLTIHLCSRGYLYVGADDDYYFKACGHIHKVAKPRALQSLEEKQ